ncbi:hypothetical protein NAG74_27425 [Sinorhizobium meliloti]|nr:hypothetical protein [Sinorhizobium meliloti]MCO5965487.1 hypothetical protein [Sinorhizobium meliloti]
MAAHWRHDLLRRGNPLERNPVAIINASYEAAFLELTNPGSLSPVVTGWQTVKHEKVG